MTPMPWSKPTSADRLSDVRDTSLAKVVRDEVLALILGGELAAGQRINEPDVAARLQVSRVPVREALRELESAGLVATRKHAGAFVRVLDAVDVAELYELRAVLDGHAGRRAAQLDAAPRRALVRRLAALCRDMARCARARDVQGYHRANLAFHWAVVEAAGNRALAERYRGVIQQLHLSRLTNLAREAGMAASMREHDGIVAALSDGDAELSRARLEGHVTASHRRLADPDAAKLPPQESCS